MTFLEEKEKQGMNINVDFITEKALREHQIAFLYPGPIGFIYPSPNAPVYVVFKLIGTLLHGCKKERIESLKYECRLEPRGVTHHTTCYAPAFKKSVERGLFLDIRRRKASSTFLLKKGCFFPLYRHLGVLFRKVGFEGFDPFRHFSRGYNLKDWSSINFPFYIFIWCLIPCRAHLLTDNDI